MTNQSILNDLVVRILKENKGKSWIVRTMPLRYDKKTLITEKGQVLYKGKIEDMAQVISICYSFENLSITGIDGIIINNTITEIQFKSNDFDILFRMFIDLEM